MAKPKVWAHRGASADAPENTLPAFELAREMGAHGVELDVQLTADGHIVCCHDETVDRTTDGTGAVVGMTLEQLRRLDASNGMSGFSGVTVPTLREVFELLRDSELLVNVELKNSLVPYEGLEQAVLDLVEEMRMGKRVILSTFNHISLATLRDMGATVPTAMLFGDPMWRPWRYARKLGVAAIHPPHQYLRYVPGLVKSAHKNDMAVNAWTVNEVDDMRRVVKLRVDAIITNHPDRALELTR